MPNLFSDAAGDARPWLFRVFFFTAFLFLLYQLIRLLAPFFDGIMVAITLSMVFYPVHVRFLKWTRHRPSAAAGLSLVTLFLMVFLPMFFFLGMLGKQSAALYPWAQEQVARIRANPEGALIHKLPLPAQKLWARAETLMDESGFDPQDILLRNLEGLGGSLSSFGATAVRNVVLFLFHTFVTLFALFFLFRDGRRGVERLVQLVPMERAYKEHILERLNQTLTAVVRGMFITAIVQGILAGVGFGIAGVKFSVVLGFATAFFAMVPLIGATTVWLPVGVYTLLSGSPGWGMFLLIWGAGVVSLVDNFLRPWLIGDKARLPIVLLFFGTLGGLKAYGPTGLFIGPVMVACVLAFAKIYGEQLSLAGTTGLVTPKPDVSTNL